MLSVRATSCLRMYQTSKVTTMEIPGASFVKNSRAEIIMCLSQRFFLLTNSVFLNIGNEYILLPSMLVKSTIRILHFHNH